MAMPGEAGSFVSPGPAPGTAPAGTPPSQVGVRTAPRGRPTSSSRGVVPPPNKPVAPPGGGAGGSGGPGNPSLGQLRPASQAAPAAPGAPAGAQTRMPTSPELDMMTSGMSAQLPVGQYTVGPDGQPTVILNEQGQAQYQARMERFAQAYRASMPPELRNSDVPIPQVTVGQRVLNPWSGQWITV